jgi:hypothetical protein
VAQVERPALVARAVLGMLDEFRDLSVVVGDKADATGTNSGTTTARSM